MNTTKAVPTTFLMVLLLVGMLKISSTQAQSTNDMQTSAMGVHGMVIFTDGEQFFASHMPLANSIHAHQIIFSFTLSASNTQKLQLLLSKTQLVSLVPEPFDLMRLMSGDLEVIKGTFVKGHFERGGEAAFEEPTIRLENMLLNTNLDSDISQNGYFYILATGKQKGFAVHRIAQTPSFDQILQITGLEQVAADEGRPTLVKISDGEPVSMTRATEIKTGDLSFILNRPIYLETRDFQ